MIRLPLISNDKKNINIILSFNLLVNITNEFTFKSPKPLIKFHMETNIKYVWLFIVCGIGFEVIQFFKEEEHKAIVKVLTSAAEYARSSKSEEIYE